LQDCRAKALIDDFLVTVLGVTTTPHWPCRWIIQRKKAMILAYESLLFSSLWLWTWIHV